MRDAQQLNLVPLINECLIQEAKSTVHGRVTGRSSIAERDISKKQIKTRQKLGFKYRNFQLPRGYPQKLSITALGHDETPRTRVVSSAFTNEDGC